MDPRDPETFDYADIVAKRSGTGGSVSVEVRDDGRYLVIEDCQTRGQSKAACKCFCAIAARSFWRELDPESEIDWVDSKANGDPSCRIAIKRKGVPNPVSAVMWVVRDCDAPLSKEDWDFWGRATAGENWAIVTRALVDRMGDEKAVALMDPYMRQSGLAFGLRWAQSSKLSGSEDWILAAVYAVQESFGMKLSGTRENEGQLNEVTACPFSGSSPVICHQLEAFFNGICEAIDPEYEFAYDRMMSKGDKTCHWTISKKGGLATQQSKDEAAADDPIKRLTNKYIDGEITEEDFRKKLAVLKELRL